jgi:aryl-alcohol dehydrogenase-like predicted oxidoreductase
MKQQHAVLGLGMAALGRPGYITLGHGQDYSQDRSVDGMRSRAFEVLDAAYQSGLRYFDAARSYGRAEEFLSAWISSRAIKPGEVKVASKWGYTYTADWRVDATHHEIKDHSEAALRRQLPESQALLGAYLTLYQIHSATRESGVLSDERVLDSLALLRDQGVEIGLSVSGPAQPEVISQATSIMRAGSRLFASVQATWNLLEQSSEEALRQAHEAGLRVVIKESLANGRLTSRGDVLSPLRDIAAHHGVTPDAVAISFVLSQSWVDVVLSGAVSPSQLNENLASQRCSLSGDELRSLASLKEEPSAYWAKRSGLAWT